MNDESLPRAARLRSGHEIRHLLRTGCRRRAGCLDIFVAPGTTGEPRLAVIAPLYGRSAVERNRLRRRLREIARREWLARLRKEGRRDDLLVRAREEAYDRTYRELRALVREATERECGA